VLISHPIVATALKANATTVALKFNWFMDDVWEFLVRPNKLQFINDKRLVKLI
jgi:hypothetical protein